MNKSNYFLVLISVLMVIAISIFLSGCAISGCGNPNTTSTMSDSNNVTENNQRPPLQEERLSKDSYHNPNDIPITRNRIRPIGRV